MTRMWKFLIALLVLAMVAAACGDDDDDTSASASASEPAEEPAEEAPAEVVVPLADAEVPAIVEKAKEIFRGELFRGAPPRR